ncbi:uncharacterized protein LOC117607972 [Osmia lignaria lignaria]|uniref:uncharacterized protein LOC117607972 n=1 Tax=Osmia lignaria lignaria TaxID=1437193 RepID=UPI00402BCC57
MFSSIVRVLPVLGILINLIEAQYQFVGNASTTEASSKMEATLRPDVARPPEPILHHPPVPPNHFLPVPQRTFVHHRSDSVPYVYDHPYFGYPVAHSIDYPIGPSSKQLVIVSFIGLLLLFAVIQNTIATVKRRDMLTDVLSARRKRELYAAYGYNSVTPEQEDVLNEDARIRCIQRTVCLENRKLLKTFGAAGKVLAKYLTRSVGKSLKSTSGWDRLVEDAGEAGIRGEDCEVLYRACDQSPPLKDRRKTGSSHDTQRE